MAEEYYNCRCWAEPYVPQKSEHKRLQIDLSGLHPIDELKPTKFDSKDATLYAANDKANVASDATIPASSSCLIVFILILIVKLLLLLFQDMLSVERMALPHNR